MEINYICLKEPAFLAASQNTLGQTTHFPALRCLFLLSHLFLFLTAHLPLTIIPFRQGLCSPLCPESVWQTLGSKSEPFKTSQAVQGFSLPKSPTQWEGSSVLALWYLLFLVWCSGKPIPAPFHEYHSGTNQLQLWWVLTSIWIAGKISWLCPGNSFMSEPGCFWAQPQAGKAKVKETEWLWVVAGPGDPITVAPWVAGAGSA